MTAGRTSATAAHAADPPLSSARGIRHAKALAADLSNMLKKKEPWDREVQFQRESLRQAYLRIMFDKPTADGGGAPSAPSRPLSTQRRLDVFNLIWIETSHAVIHAYRARLAEMDKQIASSAPPPRRPRDQAPGSRTGAPGPTARRRLVHSFRAFLGAEEDFYRSIAARLARDLSDRDLAGLRAVGITPALAVPSQNAANAGHGRFERDDPAAAREMDMDVAAHDAHATRRERRELALPLVHKALIYFGDLARYRELYNEPQPPMQPKHPGGGRKGNKQQQQQAQPQEKRQKNWARAAECYHQARLLIPDQGNPSNQLAVLSAYAGDSLSSTYHYYRALTVRSPFPTARTNLDNSYSKAIDKYFSSQALQQSAQGEDGADATQLKEAFIALHGIFFTGKHLADLQTVSTRVDELLKPCVEQRLLTSETLVKIIVTALCSLWNARMFRSGTNDGAAAASSKRAPPPAPAKDMPNLEPEIVMHVLSLFRTLLDVAAAETTEPVDSVANGDEDMSLRISAVLRRMLPPLRIFSKWLMGQLDYISRTELRLQAREVKQQRAADSGIDKGQDKPALATATAFQESMRAFWDAYAALATGLRRAFSIERMPAVVTDAIVWLEEDVDMLGFSPLRRRAGKDGPLAVFDAARAEEAGAERGAQVQSNAHPNEEQLMRIRDLQEDALVLAQSESCPQIQLRDGVYVHDSTEAKTDDEGQLDDEDVAIARARLSKAFNMPELAQQPPFDERQIYDEDDVHMEIVDEDEEVQTEDDPIELAMRVATSRHPGLEDHENESDDEEEQIVYRSSSAPRSADQTPARRSSNPGGVPTQDPQQAQQRGPNASDLLHQVLSGSVPNSRASPSGAFATTASPPIGGRSIWAPTDSTTTAGMGSFDANAAARNAFALPFGNMSSSPGAGLFGPSGPWTPQANAIRQQPAPIGTPQGQQQPNASIAPYTGSFSPFAASPAQTASAQGGLALPPTLSPHAGAWAPHQQQPQVPGQPTPWSVAPGQPATAHLQQHVKQPFG